MYIDNLIVYGENNIRFLRDTMTRATESLCATSENVITGLERVGIAAIAFL